MTARSAAAVMMAGLLVPSIVPGIVSAAVSAAGRLEGAEQTRVLEFAETGSIAAILVVEGQGVKAGQVLAQLECEPQKAELRLATAELTIARRGGRREAVALAEANVTKAERELDLARARLRRLEPIVAQNLASRGELEDTRLLVGVADAGLTTARQALALEKNPLPAAELEAAAARVALAQARVARCVLAAPADGVILRRYLEPGAAVSALAPQPVLSFASLKEWRVRAEVDEEDVGGIKPGQRVTVLTPAFAKRPVTGKVVSLSPLMGRRRVLSGDPGEKLDRDVLEVLIVLTEPPPVPAVGLRVRVVFDEENDP